MVDSVDKKKTILGMYENNQTKNLITFHNKEPQWSERLQAHTLNFYGRSKQASVKNFLLVDEYDSEIIYMLMGKVS